MQYVNDMFVGDVHMGNIYHFDLNEARTDLVLGGGLLADKVADSDSELGAGGGDGGGIIFGKGFGGITDLEVGPDGYLYVVSIGQGAIYRIVQTSDGHSTITTAEDVATSGDAEDVDNSYDGDDGSGED
jgi:aldose sugar dehydrogenase